MKRIGFIGYGLRSETMMKAFRTLEADITVAAIADPRWEEIAPGLKGDPYFVDTHYYMDADEMLEKETLDGVFIGTRCSLHTPYACKVLEMGLPLFLEKPVSITREQYEMLREAAKGKEHKVYDELFFDSADTDDGDRFAGVDYIESLSPEEKFEFFKKELSKCIRCNACRNVCPACSCRKCVFDSTKFDADRKANVDPFEESMFHIIRAFHVAGRCTDCGECSRVCPQGIPLHLFNRKFIKDINEFYGEYQAGAEVDERSPLTNFTFDDLEPGERR